MKKLWISLVFITVVLLSFGQQTSSVIKRINLFDYSLQAGIYGGSSTNSTQADFNILAPNSVLLNSNLFPNSVSFSPYYYQRNPNSLFSATLGFQFSDKQKTKYNKNIELRVGITYSHNSILSGGYYDTERKTFDTLTSSQTGVYSYLDSVVTKSLEMNYSSEQLRLDGSLIFRTNPDARWSFYSGIGITAGFSFNAKTTIVYNTQYQIEQRMPNNHSTHLNVSGDNSQYEVFSNQNNFAFSAYIPLGINLRLGKNTEFWKKVNLFYEIRPNINITYIPELRTVTNAFLQIGCGFRFKL